MFKPNKKLFKSGTGHWVTKSLFYETGNLNKEFNQYTLKEHDHRANNGKEFPSLYRLYIEMNDPTEYEFANEYLYNWSHWKKLTECDWFQPYLKAWREELSIKQQALALRNMQQMANDQDHKGYYQASKFLLDKGWEEKRNITRTAKEKIKQEAQKLRTEEDIVQDAAERILN